MRAALVAAVTVGTSCAPPSRGAPPVAKPLEEPDPPTESARSPKPKDPIVLVTLDGTRWQEVFDGTDEQLERRPRRPASKLVPNLDRLARKDGAAVGAPGRGLIRATGPNYVSLPGYTEILTGRAPIGCQDNTCPVIETPTLLDEVHSAGGRVAAFGSWEMLDRAVSSRPGSFYVSCGRYGDKSIDPWPGSGDFRPDRLTAKLALTYLETEQPDLLYIGLGEPDEYGHHGDYPGYLTSLAQADAFIGDLIATLSRMGKRGASTHLFVTADHGRAADFKNHGGGAPESARVWLIAAGPSIVARGRVISSSERHLADVAPTLRSVLGMTGDRDAQIGRGETLAELFVD